jgi:ATP/maltotriose-dependent transcriptional regulator MalT
MMSAGRFDEVAGVLSEAGTLATAAGARTTELRVSIELAFLEVFLDRDVSGAIARVEEIVPELESLDDDRGLAQAWHLLGEPYVVSCQWGKRIEMLERALPHARRTGNRRLVSNIAGQLCGALFYGPVPVDEALQRCESMRDEARLGALSTLAALHAMRGDFDAAREQWSEAARGYEELGLRFRRAARSLLGAHVELLAGDVEAAVAELRFGESELASMGERGVRSTVSAYLADALYGAGRLDEALAATETSEEFAEPDDVGTHVVWRCARAKVLAERGGLEQADALSSAAERLAEPTEFPELQAAAHTSRARVLSVAGDDEGARACLRRAHEIYTAKGNTVAARRTAEALTV